MKPLGDAEMNQGETKRWHVILLVLGAAVLVRPTAGGADELGELKQELQDQKARSAELENRISQLVTNWSRYMVLECIAATINARRRGSDARPQA